MHLNYYFLKKVSAALKTRLAGFTLESCFSQAKDEIVLGFASDREEFYLKAILTSRFSALAFPSDFKRKRQNSVDLFKELDGQTVTDVTQHQNERSFYISFTNGFTLLFKLFGNRSNLILFEKNSPLNRFHQKFPDDFKLNFLEMNRSLSFVFPENKLTLKELQKLIPTFGDLPLIYLNQSGFETLDLPEQHKKLNELFEELNKSEFRIIELDGKIRLSLIPIGEVLARFNEPLQASDYFASKYQAEHYFRSTSSFIRQQLERNLLAATKNLEMVETKLKSLATDTSFSQTADIIMANLTSIPAGASEASLYDFYQDRERLIKLNKDEKPQKTAEKLYRKSKNQQIEIKLLSEKALRKTEEIIELEEKLAALEKVTDNRSLRQFIKEYNLQPEKETKQQESLFREFETEGFTILVGKSAQNNDILTQKHTHKDDLWLHAKDVSGSHVVVKFRSGKPFPATVIEKAAQLAAYYSKRKSDTLCPVLYTPKKYVRKPKGAEPGSVKVEREQVILVTPKNPFERVI